MRLPSPVFFDEHGSDGRHLHRCVAGSILPASVRRRLDKPHFGRLYMEVLRRLDDLPEPASGPDLVLRTELTRATAAVVDDPEADVFPIWWAWSIDAWEGRSRETAL